MFYSRNLFKTKSKYSETRLCDFIAKILGDYPKRECETDSNENFVCAECLGKIDEYDLACVTANRVETELRVLLLKSESLSSTEAKLEPTEGLFMEPIKILEAEDGAEVETNYSDNDADGHQNDDVADDEDYIPSAILITSPNRKRTVSTRLRNVTDNQEYSCKRCDMTFQG